MAATRTRATSIGGEIIGVALVVLALAWAGWYLTGLVGWSGHARWCTAGALGAPLAWRYIKAIFRALFDL